MAAICSRHSGWKPAERNRALLDEKLRPLPDCQAGDAGHTCAYCAYELGYQDGREAAIRSITKKIGEQIASWAAPKTNTSGE